MILQGKVRPSQWDNGKLLAQKLEEIYNHFGKKLILWRIVKVVLIHKPH